MLGSFLNNPLNIRWNALNNWKGLSERKKHNGFCVFTSLEYGCRAALILLVRYVNSGHDTIPSILYRWAPPSENDTESYIKYVCRTTGYNYQTKIDDITKLINVCSAMAYFESHSSLSSTYLSSIVLKYNIKLK